MTIEAKLDRIIEILETKGDKWIALSSESSPSKAGRKARGEIDGKAVAPATTGPTPTAAQAVNSVVTQAEAAAIQQAVLSTAPVGNKDEMKKAVLAYRDATDQDTALKLLTAVGAENFGMVKPEFYQQVQDSAVAALAAVSKPAVKEVDPFDDGEPAASAVGYQPTLADVKKAFVARQKHVSEALLLGVLTSLGAVGAGAPGQPPTPSLKHLDASKFAAAIAAVNALPKTK